MHRFWTFLITTALVGVMAPAALAQADAQAAWQQAKAAYQAGKFPEARDLAKKAAQTDAKNAEVFLLLGKAHYQLGELDDALAAWKRTLALAPAEPFAAKMIEVLRAQKVGVDLRIRLVEAMIPEKLFAAARQETAAILADKSLSESQRARVMTLQADLAVRTGQPEEAQKLIHEVLVLYPKQADPIETTLLLGQAKLRLGGEATAEGLAALKKLIADHADVPAAATARYELIAFALKQGVDAAGTDALGKWISDNPDHPLAMDARQTLIEAYLALSRQGAKPASKSGLHAADVKALALVVEVVKRQVRAEPNAALAERLLKHLETQYAANQAVSASIQGVQTLLGAPLPRPARLAALKALGLYKYRAAMDWLVEQGRAGQLPAAVQDGTLPPPLAEVLAVYQAIRTEFPTEPLWADQVGVAVQTRPFVSRVVWSDEVKAFRGPDAWAIEIVLPAVKANADPAAVKTAVELIQGVIQDYSGVGQPGARQLALTASRRLIAAPLSPSHAAWPGVMNAHATLLDAYAKHVFQENIKSGNGEENSKLSETQKEFLGTLSRLVAADPYQAPAAVKAAQEHVKPWIEHRHWANAEEVYTTLAKAMPERERWQAGLAVVELWIQQAFQQHQRLAEAGLTIPRELDPVLKKAMLRCYELQAGLDPESPRLARVRGIAETIVVHYKGLEYDDVAEAAIKVKPEKPVEAADEYAAFQLVRLQEEQAGRELSRILKQHAAAERTTLTPAFQAAIAAWKKFMTDRPASPLVPKAAERITGIAQLFEQHAAHAVAAGVYGDLAKFAAGVKVLAESSPTAPSVAQRAAFARAAALDAQARRALTKAMADRKSDEAPPGKLSDEFAAAIAAYQGLIEAYPESPLARETLGKIMAVALEYAKIDSWDVAESIYADLAKSKLAIRRPERLEFARGVCQLGRAMPDHAREVLTALSGTGLRGPSDSSGPMIAAATSREGIPGTGGMRDPAKPAEQPAGEPERPTTPPAAGPPVATATKPVPAQTEAGGISAENEEAKRDIQLLAAIRRQEANRSSQVAQLRLHGQLVQMDMALQQKEQQDQQPQVQRGRQAPPVPVLSEAELARQEKALDAAYAIFQGIRKAYAETPTAEQARSEILLMATHWRSLTQWQRAAALAARYLADNPTDGQLSKLRLEIARDRLAWASKPLEKKVTRQAMLAEVAGRFAAARAELAKIVAEFAKERSLQQEAQWDIANSFLTEARVIGTLSPTLARGQFVRASRELQSVADKYPSHPKIGSIPQMLSSIAQEMEGRGYDEEAIVVLSAVAIQEPTGSLAQSATQKIAQTYHQKLKRPLKAAETYQELNFLRGGSDQAAQDAIFKIGSELKEQKRWVEALHVLEAFVDTFPRHAQAGQALAMVGQIHQANEAWKDAIAAYRRVIAEFTDGQWVQDAKWSIAECTINLSQWSEASVAYRDYGAAYPKDAKVAEANRRIDILKDLVRYQGLIDEKGQRKAFDAQYQIAVIVRNQLSNPVKAILEYRKVVANWPESYVAAPALYEMGTAYLALGETEKARDALGQVATKYPTSPLASSALFMVGKSYEDEADRLATVTREKSLELAKDVAQRNAYDQAQNYRRDNLDIRQQRIASLKKGGKGQAADVEEASAAAQYGQFNDANVLVFASKASQEVEALTASQLADRQDKINAALRKAVAAYEATSKIAGGNKADAALLQMATIYDQRLKDSKAAMQAWLEIVRQFSGTAVAEDASWKLAQYYEREGKHAQAVDAYTAFLRNYRRSPNAGAAQFAIAENYERLGQWVAAMDSYTNYLTNFPEGPLVNKAKEQINWIKTYRL